MSVKNNVVPNNELQYEKTTPTGATTIKMEENVAGFYRERAQK
jgi:hypothetical protein